jgi:hypothetical protein
MKVTSGCIEPQSLHFDISLSLSTGLQRSLVPPCIISLGRPGNWSLPEHLSLPLVYCEGRVSQSFVIGVVICKRLFVLSS